MTTVLKKVHPLILIIAGVFALPAFPIQAMAGDSMEYVIFVTTTKDGVGSQIYLDNKPITGIDASFDEQKTIPSEEGLLIDIGDGNDHTLFLRKTDSAGNYVDYPKEPILLNAIKSKTMGLHINWGEVKKTAAAGYSLNIRTTIAGQLMVDGVPRANLRVGEVFSYEFPDKSTHWLQIQPGAGMGAPISLQVSPEDSLEGIFFGQAIKQTSQHVPAGPDNFFNTISDEYWFYIGVVAIILISILILFLLLRKKKSFPAGVVGPVQSGGSTSLWPEYMRLNYPHLEPIKHFATGGMSNIWIAKNMHKDNPETYKKKTAIKILHEQFNYIDSPEATRFMDEALILNVLEPTGYVPKVYARSSGQAEPGVRLWFELEFLEDYDALRDKVGGKQSLRLPLEDADRVMHEMTLSVLKMHQKGVVHRDLSPENVMVRLNKDHWDLKLLDFGISKAAARLAEDTQFSTEMTMAAELLGKAKYSSPEQWNEGLGSADLYSDWYAVGIMYWEMITGKVPYESRSEHDKGGKSLDPLISAGVNEEKAQVVVQMFAPKKEDRPKPEKIIQTFM